MHRLALVVAAAAALRHAFSDSVLEAVVRTANMSTPEYWEAHHVLARLKPGTSWFGPITARLARRYARRQRCEIGDAVVLGVGYSRAPYWLARTGAFERVYGVDTSASAVSAMRRHAAALSHGGTDGWARVRYVLGDAARALPAARRRASLVIDEGVLDILQGATGGRAPEAQRAMDAFLAAAGALVAPGGELALVGYAGRFERVANVSGFATSCWARRAAGRGFGATSLADLYQRPAPRGDDSDDRDPRRACSPSGGGAYLLRRRRPS